MENKIQFRIIERKSTKYGFNVFVVQKHCNKKRFGFNNWQWVDLPRAYSDEVEHMVYEDAKQSLGYEIEALKENLSMIVYEKSVRIC